MGDPWVALTNLCPMRMRVTLRSFPAVLAAALYVLLGIAAAWHAPHFSRGEVAVGQDGHKHHEAVKAQDCAACAWKTAAQDLAAAGKPFFGQSGFATTKLSRHDHADSGFLRARFARGPPSLS